MKIISLLTATLSLTGAFFAQQLEITEITKRIANFHAVGDLNDDGYPEIVFLENNVRIHWGSSTADISPAQILDITPGYIPGYTSCEITDLNNDGRRDIIISQLTPNELWIYQNNPDGTFTKQVVPVSLTGNFSFKCFDVDVDGKNDILFFEDAPTAGPLHYRLNNGNWNFGTMTFHFNFMYGFKKYYDVDSDGRTDFFSHPKVYLNQTYEPFEDQFQTLDMFPSVNNMSSMITDALYADIDMDGLIDYIYIYDNSYLGCRLNESTTFFQSLDIPVQLQSLNSLSNLVEYQYDADPNPEFLVVAGGNINLIDYDPLTTSLSTTLIYSNGVGSFELVDFNNDGYQDFLIKAGSQLRLALNDGTNHFNNTKTLTFSSSASGYAFDYGDLDGNGNKDLVFYTNNELVWTKQLSNGYYSDLISIDNTYDALQIDLSDIDNDGDLDIVMSDYYYYMSSIDNMLFNYYKNDGSGNFSGPFNISTYIQGKHQKIANLNDDEFPDIVLTDYSNSFQGRISYFRNNQQSGFTRVTVDSQLSGTDLPFALSDVDNNGYKDIVVGVTNSLTAYYNDGAVFSSANTLVNFSAFQNSLLAADLDNDGDDDFITAETTGSQYKVNVLWNNAGLLTLQPHNINSGTFDDLTFMDFNEDGFPDIVFALGYQIGIMENTGTGNFDPPYYITMNERLVAFKEIKHSTGHLINILAESFERGIYSLEMPANTAVLGTDIQTTCESYEWSNDIVYSTSNYTATQVLTSLTTGNDSIVTLNLTIYGPVYSTDTQTACESYTWIDGNTYTVSENAATDTVTSLVTGCDSIVTLNLTIPGPVYGTDTQIACESYTWIDGNTYTASENAATDTVTSLVTGCDSIVTLNLTIFNTSYSSVDVEAANSYHWAQTGEVYTLSGTYLDTILNLNGCDSVITLNLDLNLLQVNTFITASHLTNCTGVVSINALDNPNFTFDLGSGFTPVTSQGSGAFIDLCPGIYSLKTTDGNNDTIHTLFIIPNEFNSIFVNPLSNQEVTDSISAFIENCDIDFTSIDTVFIDSYTMVTSDSLEVVWKIVDQQNTTLIPVIYHISSGAGNYYLQIQLFCPEKIWGSGFVATEGVYYSNGTISTLSTEVIASDGMLLYPTNGKVHIVNPGQEISLVVYDTQGKQLLQSSAFSDTVIDLGDFSDGIYIMTVLSANERRSVRIVKY